MEGSDVLVLTRKVGEGIAIGDDVKIIVMQIKGKQVRLGIKASAQTTVHREEIYQRIQEENRSASQLPNTAVVSQAEEIFSQQLPKQPVGQVPIRRHSKSSRNSGDGEPSDD